MKRRSWPRLGLRRSLLTRVASTFALAVALTALGLSLAAYFLTRDALLSGGLEEALEQSRQNLTIAEAMLPADPGPADYEALMPAFSIRGDFDTLVQTETDTYRSGLGVTDKPITPELASAVAEGRIRYQSVPVDGETTIVVGSSLRSGQVTIYFFFPQGARLAQLAALRNILISASLLLAVLGAIVGYVLARRMLRPISTASRAAIEMSHGDLDIRLPSGPDEFGALADSFNQMAANLQDKMLDLEAGQARERRFVADVTHELRTPISALVGEASLLKAKMDKISAADDPELERLAQLVVHDVSRLRLLVDDLLEVCRLDSQALDTVVEPLELQPFLARLVEAHGWTDKVSIVQAPAASWPDSPPTAARPTARALADKRLLERIVVNLVENALAHGAPPVSIEVRSPQPDPGIPSTAQRTVSIAIRDNGPGIPLRDLPHIFDRFYKADPSRSAGKGSGLGLAIARENARLLGGDIAAANQPHGGALFVLTLPDADL